jgi:hypothetical protein
MKLLGVLCYVCSRKPEKTSLHLFVCTYVCTLMYICMYVRMYVDISSTKKQKRQLYLGFLKETFVVVLVLSEVILLESRDHKCTWMNKSFKTFAAT